MLHYIGITEGEGREDGADEILEEIRAKNF